MTYSEFTSQIGAEVTKFLNKFQYDGKEKKDAFWVKEFQGEMSWAKKYATTDYSMMAFEIIAAIHNVVEMDTMTKEDI